MDNLRSQSLRFVALTTSLYTRGAWGLAGRGARVREIYLPRTVEIGFKVFAHYPHSSPPQRMGQGWWFAIPRSSARQAIKMRRRHPISTV